MFSRFNLDINDSDCFVSSNYSKGVLYVEKSKKTIKEELDRFIMDDGSIDGTDLQKNWFETLNFDVFISHSHKDTDSAIALAGWLNSELGLTAFVDTCFWGYADSLLKIINDKYNITRIESDGEKIYSHKKANYASSHVHMMLATSINKMMMNCECVIFINSNNSVIKSDYSEETSSPWIYLEICLANSMKQMIPKRFGRLTRFNESFSRSDSNELLIKYKLDFIDFLKINKSDLLIWKKECSATNEHPLNVLYRRFGIIK